MNAHVKQTARTLVASAGRIAGRVSRRAISTIVVIALAATQLMLFASPASAAASADLDQCRNGAFATPAQCVGNGSGGSGWVNGNSNATQAHWREGEYLPYRARLAGLVTGAVNHSLHIEWDTTHGGKHAIDYIGTYNQTEVTANPCSTVSGCPASTLTVPVPTDPMTSGMLAGHAQEAGVVTCFGCTVLNIAGSYDRSGSFATNDVQGLTFTFRTSVSNPVLAWAGHIASQFDWGTGNSAISINGSPYHTRILELDGKGGNQDRSLAAAAVAGPPDLATAVSSTTVGAGDPVTDTATFTGTHGTVTGTATFFLCGPQNSATGCTEADATRVQVGTAKTLASGVAVSDAVDTSGLTAGKYYCFGVLYENDGASFYADGYYDSSNSTSTECFRVVASPTVSTTLHNETLNTSAAGGNTLDAAIGNTIHDSATLSGATSNAGGTIAYTYWESGDCTGTSHDATPAVDDVVNGSAPNSTSIQFNNAGTFSWKATYSGDANNSGPVSSLCNEILVVRPNPTIATSLSGGGQSGASISVPVGTTVSDSATLSDVTADAGGTVTYQVFTDAGCTTQLGSDDPVTVTNGSVPDSSAITFNTAGTFYFLATYSGDAKNNGPVDSGCGSEILTVVSTGQPGATPGFWGNKNGHAVIVNEGLLPVTLGVGSRTFTVTTLAQSDKILGKNGCTATVFNCAATGLASGLNANTFEVLAAQTLALIYNGLHFAGFLSQSVSDLGCTVPDALVGALGTNPTLSAVRSYAQTLIGNSASGGSTTQALAGGMNSLLGCINQI